MASLAGAIIRTFEVAELEARPGQAAGGGGGGNPGPGRVGHRRPLVLGRGAAPGGGLSRGHGDRRAQWLTWIGG